MFCSWNMYFASIRNWCVGTNYHIYGLGWVWQDNSGYDYGHYISLILFIAQYDDDNIYAYTTKRKLKSGKTHNITGNVTRASYLTWWTCIGHRRVINPNIWRGLLAEQDLSFPRSFLRNASGIDTVHYITRLNTCPYWRRLSYMWTNLTKTNKNGNIALTKALPESMFILCLRCNK